jgi:NAD(P)-dependent dehydrogenase (short-subunit alcohol dehydrogenase family)
MQLAGKLALVTGGAMGLGRAIALALSHAGARVVIVDRDAAAGEAAARELAGGRFVAADVTDERALRRLFEQLRALDVLVNNAGGVEAPVFPHAPAERWSAVLDLNLRAPMLAMQLALGSMRRRGEGAIVNVSSSAAVGLVPHPAPEYAAAKAGLMRLTAALAPLAEEGIRVSCVCPGMVDTPASRRTRAAMTPEERSQVFVRPAEDVARLIVELAADDASGGRVVSWLDREEPRVLR